MIYQGFEPVYDSNSRVLILGSFPSIASREGSFYYAHPTNRFWHLLGELFKIDLYTLDIKDKKQFLLDKNIALCDSVFRCKVEGSLDKNIQVEEVANLSKIVKVAKLERILCNGRLSHRLANKHYVHLGIPIFYMPSTSAANNRLFDKSIWFSHLRTLLD